ncbi:hypothetical protein ACQJBY_053757 [Aegilops geniculata]
MLLSITSVRLFFYLKVLGRDISFPWTPNVRYFQLKKRCTNRPRCYRAALPAPLLPRPKHKVSARRRRRPSIAGHRPNLLSTMSSGARRKKYVIPTKEGGAPASVSSARKRRRRPPPTREEPGPTSPALGDGTTQSRIPDEEDQDAKKRNLVNLEEAEEEVVSSAPSSPICKPYIPRDKDGAVYNRFRNPEIYKALRAEEDKLREKLGFLSKPLITAQRKLPTLDFESSACLSDDEQVLHVRESGTEAVLRAANFVLALSSFADGKPLQRCSGILFEWNDHLKTGVVLTTAHIIRSNCPSIDHWLGKDEYRPDAKVVVHFLDDTTAEGDLVYHQEHYDIAFFKVEVSQCPQLPLFVDNVKSGQEIFQLGRDEKLNLRITYGKARSMNPNTYQRQHFMYMIREDDDNEFDDGGPAIDFSANVVGMINNSTSGSFIPTCILHECFYFWKNHGCIPRLHLRLKLFAIKLLDPSHIERIRRKCKIDSGLIVEEVSSGSHAEMLGICRGDIISCFEGEEVSTTVQLEKMMLDVCKNRFIGGINWNSKVDVSVNLVLVFDIRRSRWRTKVLTLDVSDKGEVIVRASRLVTI